MKLYNYHDCEIVEYNINISNKNITLILSSNSKRIVLVFNNVTVHKFSDVRQQNVLDYIEKKSPEDFVIDNKTNLDNFSQKSWPVSFKSEKELVMRLKELNQFYFRITAVLGLNGFILADSMEEDIIEKI